MNDLTDPLAQTLRAESLEPIGAQATGALLSDFDRLPRVLEADELAALSRHRDLLVVDVRAPEQCIDGHIPGAVLLSYDNLVQQRGAVVGSLPDANQLSRVLSGIGLDQSQHVVAYDDDKGSHAARLLWTLDVIGHDNYSLLNGGFAAWDEQDLPIAETPRNPKRSSYRAVVQADRWADYDYVLSRLDCADTILLDARSPEEFRGENIRAARGGRIPGAVNFEWSLALDLLDNGRLRGDAELVSLFGDAGVTRDKEIIVYCHSHHRSSHTYLALKQLGFSRVRAYAGSWSEWGNREDAPIEVEIAR